MSDEDGQLVLIPWWQSRGHMRICEGEPGPLPGRMLRAEIGPSPGRCHVPN